MMMFEQIITWDNLLLAYQRASKGKRGRADVAAFEYYLEDHLYQLKRELTQQTYKPGAYHSFVIHKPKKRIISAAPFRDRVVHHALCQVVEPLFERSFLFDSYANRVGKGTHKALDRCQYFSRRYRYVLQCDVRQFFPSIDHSILRGLLAKKIQDSKVMWLVDQILGVGAGVPGGSYEKVFFPGDDLFAFLRPVGLPIGNLTSQFWANVYMNPMDQFIKRELRCKGYLRYVDDFLLFGQNKSILNAWRNEVIRCLSKMRLVIHPTAQVRPVNEGIPFLGFLIYPQSRRLKRRNIVNARRRMKVLYGSYAKHEISIDQLSASILGWVNHVRYGNTVGLRKRMLPRSVTKINDKQKD